MAEANTNTNGDGHLNGLGTKKAARRKQSRETEEPARDENHMIDFTGDGDVDVDTMAAWTDHLQQRLQDAIFALIGGLDDVEETGARWRDLMKLRRYRQIWRKTSDPLFDQARQAYDAAHEAALEARNTIEDVSMDLVRHSSVLAGIALEETGNLARLREVADEVTSICYATPQADLNDLQVGLEADVLVSRSMHLLVLLQREARHVAERAASCRAARARPLPQGATRAW
jgi:hypothetical protein